MSCRAGDVVLVRFVFTDQVGAKQRPAVVLSSEAYQENRADVVMMPLTSQPPGHYGDSPVDGWKAAGLLAPSHFKAVIQTIEQAAIVKTIGRLTQSDIEQARTIVRSIVELS